MPRDLLAEPQAQPTPAPDLSVPSLAGLSWLLRHPEQWSTHKWCFEIYGARTECGTVGCAMGVAWCQWAPHNFNVDFPVMHWGKNTFNLNEDDFASLFLTAGYEGTWDVTPDMVADQIDAYLARRA